MERIKKKNEIREEKVLIHLVDEYIKKGEPVPSKTISANYLPQVSPATIRIDLNKLEQKGFIHQPHTSAGRIPTTEGYRNYLSSIDDQVRNTGYENENLLRRILITSYKDTATTLHYVMQLLAKETDQLSFVAEPEIAYGFLERLDVFKIGNLKLLFVVSLDTGIDKAVIINCSHDITEQQLRALVRYVNEKLSGLRIYDIQHKHIEELTGNMKEVNQLFNLFLQEFAKALNEMSNYFIHFEAGISFLEQPEFDDKTSLLSFLSLTQRQDYLVNLMQDNLNNKLYRILIGEELGRKEWFDYVLVYSKYELYGIPGYLGVVAPLRMDYLKNVPIVHNMATIITEATQKGTVVLKDYNE